MALGKMELGKLSLHFNYFVQNLTAIIVKIIYAIRKNECQNSQFLPLLFTV